MSIGNWSSWSIDQDGRSARDEIVTPFGVKAAIYKNWVNLWDDQAWRERPGCSPGYAGEVRQGSLTYQDLQLEVEQKGNAVFVCAWDWCSGKVLLGIGTYAYVDGEYVGVTDTLIAEFREWVLANERSPLQAKGALDKAGLFGGAP